MTTPKDMFLLEGRITLKKDGNHFANMAFKDLNYTNPGARVQIDFGLFRFKNLLIQ